MPPQNPRVRVPGEYGGATVQPARGRCLYRVKVEPRGAGEHGEDLGKLLVLHVYQGGVEIDTLDFELTETGARGLLDEVRWLEWKTG
jgi:hypothetical protein